MSKPRVAFYWAASCGGCEESVVDLAEDLLPLFDAVDVVFWPVAMDFKRKDVEAMEDGSIDYCFFNGAIRNPEQVEMAHLMRRKSRILVAYGACAQLGGIPALANQFGRDEMVDRIYTRAPMLEAGSHKVPAARCEEGGNELTLPCPHRRVRSLDQVVAVDYALPGCPPTPKMFQEALDILAEEDLPPRGTVLAPDVALCAECPRARTKKGAKEVTKLRRTHQGPIDPDTCMLAQGIVCMGSVTRKGCGAQCLQGNMPCTGCFGPTSQVQDPGAKMAGILATTYSTPTPEDAEALVDGIPDPLGTFYRYGMSKSLLRGKAEAR